MKRFIHIYILLFVALGLSSCLDIKLDDQYSDPDAVNSTQRARELLSAAYNSLPRYQVELSILGDDFCPTSLAGRNSEMQNLYAWQEKAIDDLSSRIWPEYYYTVSLVNALLQRIPSISEDDLTTLRCIEASACALKALCYFELMKLYAPLWSEANMEKDGIILKDHLELEFLPRSPLKDCVKAISDLLDKASALFEEAGGDKLDRVYYLGPDAVVALKAELELYRGNYSEAARLGTGLLLGREIVWSKPAYDALWSENDSAERLFSPYIFNTFYTDLCYDWNVGDYFVLSDRVAFTPEDHRLDWAQRTMEMGGRTVRQMGKYNKMYYDKQDVRYINTLRWSGVLFTACEALLLDGQTSQARHLLNLFLAARGVDGVSEDLDDGELMEAVLSEKQKEFAGEGTRLWDLKRRSLPAGRFTLWGQSISSTIQSDDYRWLFPIPKSEYRYNEAVHQNPDWPVVSVE